MADIIEMPKLSDTMTVGTLVTWLKKEGDAVTSGDMLAEVETDKATMEVEAVDEGQVAQLLVDEGAEGVAVNAVIAVLAGDGEDVGDVDGVDEVGDADGDMVGDNVGTDVGADTVGDLVGDFEGETVGCALVGDSVGDVVGDTESSHTMPQQDAAQFAKITSSMVAVT